MSREIKFRAWVKPGELSNHMNGVIAEAKPDFLGKYCFIQREDLVGKKNFTEIFDFERIELMEFAGSWLVDVYEGYIIEGWFDNGNYAKGEVVFNNSRAAFMVSMWDRPNVMFYLDEIKNLNVIGNIYENPELLEGKL